MATRGGAWVVDWAFSELSADCFGFVSARSCPLLQDELCIILSARSW